MLYVPQSGNIFYPDLMLVAAPMQTRQMTENMTATLNPVVLIEILLASNSENDLIEKMTDYKTISGLKQYLIFWQTRPQVDIFTRVGESNDWLNTSHTPHNSPFKILDFSFDLADIYQKVAF
jgi:Uma2 family endonuclease